MVGGRGSVRAGHGVRSAKNKAARALPYHRLGLPLNLIYSDRLEQIQRTQEQS
jgi:hypothetical protein